MYKKWFMLIGGLFLFIVLGIVVNAETTHAATYYVSTSGNDGNNGTSTSTPWKTLSKVSGITFAADDQILLKSGDTWNNETLTLHGSGTAVNPILLSSYGTGARPHISPNTVDSICIKMDGLQGWEITNLELSHAWEGIELTYDHSYNNDYIWIENIYFHDMDHSKNSMTAAKLTPEQLNAYWDWSQSSTGVTIKASVDKGSLLHHNQPVVLKNFTLKNSTFYNVDVSFSGIGPIHRGFYYGWEDAGRIDGLLIENCVTEKGGIFGYSLEFIDNGLVKNVTTDDTGFEYVRYGGTAFLVAYSNNVTFDGIRASNAQRHPDVGFDGCGFDFEGGNNNVKLINSTFVGIDAYAVLVTYNIHWPNKNITIANNTFVDWSRDYPYKTGAIHYYFEEGLKPLGTISNNKFVSYDSTLPDYDCGNNDNCTTLPTILSYFTVSNNTRTNITPISQGKPATASSGTAANAVDGNEATNWGATGPSFPQYLQVDLGQPEKLAFIKQITKVDKLRQKDRYKTHQAMTRYYYKIEGSNDNVSWDVVLDKTIEGTNIDRLTDAVRGTYRYVKLTVTGSNDGNWAGLKEFQVYKYSSPDVNLALGATTTASSTYSDPNYSSAYLVDGDNNNAVWKGWSNAASGLPATVEIDFGANKTYNRVELYSKKDWEQKGFILQYYNGTQWVNIIPEVKGNRMDHLTYSFPAVTSSKFRVYMNDGNVQQDGFARLSEIEIYNDPTPPAQPSIPLQPYGYSERFPSFIEAEDFDLGGGGIGYHDTGSSNSGGQYRTGEGVDIGASADTGGGYEVISTANGEWMKYSAIVFSGKYDITLRAKGLTGAGSVKLWLDGILLGTFNPPANNVWSDVTLNNVDVTGGHKVIKLEIVGGNVNLNWLRFDNSYVKTWEFNTNGDTEGWTTPNIASFTTAGGSLNGTLTNSDPQMLSPDNLATNITTNKTISIKLKNGTAGKKAKVFFTTTSDSTFNETKSKEFDLNPNTAVFSEYSINMGDVPGWTGTLKQLRIDPVNDLTSSGTFSVDQVRVINGSYSWPSHLAVGGTASASTTDTANGYAASKVIDDAATTDFNGWASASTTMPQWVQVDFGENKTFGRVDLYTTSGYELRGYQIQYWNGTAWVDCFPAVTGNTQAIRVHTFTPVTGSKVRVYCNQGDAGSGFARVNEIRVLSN
ncbi:discoidin domain-containing protein [Cohnella silvisoli]|uniref:Discoidin domain-containing protein n=1 Tax=Cohnella silvisoli TaxID=2873699 RepID=A0ABV1KT27_9BACL|nr:discoidin domain-containing protein [Cohnella silvisoli]MCD9021505.1 discoidin domain-containing protein [Cohnella silvisoli]